jgi:hypothetical protein
MKRGLVCVCLLGACGSSAGGGGDDAAGSPDAATPDAASLVDAGDPDLDAPPDAAPDAPPVPADAFTLDTTKQPMTFAQLTTYFGAGETSAAVGSYTLRMRTRSACNEVTGCTPWVDPSPVSLMESGGAQHVPLTTGTATLNLDVDASPPRISITFGDGGLDVTCGYVPQTGDASWSCTGRAGAGLLWFYAYYLGSPRLDNTTYLAWRGQIASDGTYHFVSELGSELGTAVDGANNLGQLAIFGSLSRGDDAGP